MREQMKEARVDGVPRRAADMGIYRDDRSMYDELRAAAVLISRPCCQRTVYATHPMEPCAVCR